MLIAAGTAAFLVFLVAFLPASLLLRVLPPGVSLSQVSGTVWRGRAESVSIRLKSAGGLRRIGAVSWRNRPWRLPLLELDYAVELRPADGAVQLDVAAGTGGAIVLENVSGSFPLLAVDGLFAPPGWTGTVELGVQRLVLKSGFPHHRGPGPALAAHAQRGHRRLRADARRGRGGERGGHGPAA